MPLMLSVSYGDKSTIWKDINCCVAELEGLKAELAEIDENLIRNEFHYIDRGNQLARRKAIYEELYPETRARNVEGHVSNYKTSKTDSVSEDKPLFVTDTALKTGKSQTVIKEELQIAKNTIPEVKEVLKEKDFLNTQKGSVLNVTIRLP